MRLWAGLLEEDRRPRVIIARASSQVIVLVASRLHVIPIW
jgi:hypothetical protein